jgi:hypothetical protein
MRRRRESTGIERTRLEHPMIAAQHVHWQREGEKYRCAKGRWTGLQRGQPTANQTRRRLRRMARQAKQSEPLAEFLKIWIARNENGVLLHRQSRRKTVRITETVTCL